MSRPASPFPPARRLLPALMAALALLAVGALPALAQVAEPALAPAGFPDGIVRPFWSLHHLIALAAMGLIAAQLGGRALWEVPVVFLAAMLAGYVAAQMRLPLPMADFIARLSVIFFGLILAFNWRFSLNTTLFFIGLFGIFYGHGEGSEIRQSDAVSAGLGYAIGSTIIYGAGVIAGVALLRRVARVKAALYMKRAGWGIAGIGAVLLVL